MSSAPGNACTKRSTGVTAPSAGASCAASGTGDLNDTVNLPAGTSVTYTIIAAIASFASGDLITLVATPSANPDPTDNIDIRWTAKYVP